MDFPYFPGCTLTNKAKGLNETAKESVKVLGFNLKELDNWYCCQANYSTLTDNLMNHLSSVRTLISTEKEGEKLVVLCSTCYYVLKRVNNLMKKDEGKRNVVLDFLEEEYNQKVKVIHFLEFIRDEIGFDKVKKKVEHKLDNLSVACYYGCQLLRPAQEVSFDNEYSPTVFEEFLESLGCSVIDYPFKTECCGSFLTTFSSEGVGDCTFRILSSAKKNKAEIITTTCPLCNFNLDWSQKEIARKNKGFQSLPVVYITELMALALGIKIQDSVWQEHTIDPKPFLKQKGVLNED